MMVPRWVAQVSLVLASILVLVGLAFLRDGLEMIVFSVIFLGGGIWLALHALEWLHTGR